MGSILKAGFQDPNTKVYWAENQSKLIMYRIHNKGIIWTQRNPII